MEVKLRRGLRASLLLVAAARHSTRVCVGSPRVMAAASKSSSIELSPLAYQVLFMHCTKYPHRALNGLLLGDADSDSVRVSEALPLFHSNLALAPMLEVAMLLTEEYCSSKGLKIVGY